MFLIYSVRHAHLDVPVCKEIYKMLFPFILFLCSLVRASIHQLICLHFHEFANRTSRFLNYLYAVCKNETNAIFLYINFQVSIPYTLCTVHVLKFLVAPSKLNIDHRFCSLFFLIFILFNGDDIPCAISSLFLFLLFFFDFVHAILLTKWLKFANQFLISYQKLCVNRNKFQFS